MRVVKGVPPWHDFLCPSCGQTLDDAADVDYNDSSEVFYSDCPSCHEGIKVEKKYTVNVEYIAERLREG